MLLLCGLGCVLIQSGSSRAPLTSTRPVTRTYPIGFYMCLSMAIVIIVPTSYDDQYTCVMDGVSLTSTRPVSMMISTTFRSRFQSRGVSGPLRTEKGNAYTYLRIRPYAYYHSILYQSGW